MASLRPAALAFSWMLSSTLIAKRYVTLQVGKSEEVFVAVFRRRCFLCLLDHLLQLGRFELLATGRFRVEAQELSLLFGGSGLLFIGSVGPRIDCGAAHHKHTDDHQCHHRLPAHQSECSLLVVLGHFLNPFSSYSEAFQFPFLCILPTAARVTSLSCHLRAVFGLLDAL